MHGLRTTPLRRRLAMHSRMHAMLPGRRSRLTRRLAKCRVQMHRDRAPIINSRKLGKAGKASHAGIAGGHLKEPPALLAVPLLPAIPLEKEGNSEHRQYQNKHESFRTRRRHTPWLMLRDLLERSATVQIVDDRSTRRGTDGVRIGRE